MKRIVLAFVFFVVYLSVLQFSTPNIIGFDGYSHAKTAELISETGFFEEFSWLPFTSIETDYADIQILFHILLIPFTSELGVKIAAVLFSALFFTVFYWFLHKNKNGFLYSLLLLVGSTELTYRFLLTRPFVLGLTSFVLVLYFMHRKMYGTPRLIDFPANRWELKERGK